MPLIAWAPGRIPAGRVIDSPWAAWDLLPTLAEFADVKPPENIDGISLRPELTAQTQTNRLDYFYWEFHEGGSVQAVRMGDWKGIKPFQKPLELYHLAVDRAEKQDVANLNPDIVNKIEVILKKARTDSEPWPLKPADEKKADGKKKP